MGFTDGQSLVYGNDITLYGGKLCENVVQAAARDLLVEAVLQLEQESLQVLFHVHDEVVVQVPADDVTATRETVTRILSDVPEWPPGLPVACEVMVTDQYTKA